MTLHHAHPCTLPCLVDLPSSSPHSALHHLSPTAGFFGSLRNWLRAISTHLSPTQMHLPSTYDTKSLYQTPPNAYTPRRLSIIDYPFFLPPFSPQPLSPPSNRSPLRTDDFSIYTRGKVPCPRINPSYCNNLQSQRRDELARGTPSPPKAPSTTTPPIRPSGHSHRRSINPLISTCPIFNFHGK